MKLKLKTKPHSCNWIAGNWENITEKLKKSRSSDNGYMRVLRFNHYATIWCVVVESAVNVFKDFF